VAAHLGQPNAGCLPRAQGGGGHRTRGEEHSCGHGVYTRGAPAHTTGKPQDMSQLDRWKAWLQRAREGVSALNLNRVGCRPPPRWYPRVEAVIDHVTSILSSLRPQRRPRGERNVRPTPSHTRYVACGLFAARGRTCRGLDALDGMSGGGVDRVAVWNIELIILIELLYGNTP
jgi:hypothetical protein